MLPCCNLALFVGVRWFIDRYPALRQQPGSILELVMAIALIDVLGIAGLLGDRTDEVKTAEGRG
jgi:hypothetical protein